MCQIAALSILLLCPGFLAADQDETQRYAPWVSCLDDAAEHFIGPKSTKTPVLASPDQRLRAYAEIEAKLDTRTPETCENTATLYLSVSGAPFKAVFVQSAASPENRTMSSLGPAAWSADSRWLFIERGLWNYSSDCCGYDFLLYDAATQKFVKPDPLGAVLRKTNRLCGVDYGGFVGFNEENQIILRIAYWEDSLDGEVSCGVGSAEWLFDPITNNARLRTNRPERNRK
jgi:hypothetical protein